MALQMQLLLLCAALFYAVDLSQSQNLQCGTCTGNLKCVNNTSFYMCDAGGNPVETELISCPAGRYCTNKGLCLPEEAITDADVEICKSEEEYACECRTGDDMSCASETTYRTCPDAPATSNITSCDADMYCSMVAYRKLQAICVPRSILDFLREEPTCSVGSVTSSTPNIYNLQQICAEAGKPYRYFYTWNYVDASCGSYIYCERSSTGYFAILFHCSAPNQYFDTVKERCISAKPTYCL